MSEKNAENNPHRPTRPAQPAPGEKLRQAEVNLEHPSAQPSEAESSPRLPHERDQSRDMTDQAPAPVMEQAYADVSRGLQDTGKGPVTDSTYQKLKK